MTIHDPPDSQISQIRRIRPIGLILCLAAVCLAGGIGAVVLFNSTDKVALSADSRTYWEAAENGAFSGAMWFGARPPVYPLFIAAMGREPVRVAWGQLVIGIVSWTLLAVAVFFATQSRLSGLIGAALVLLLNLSPNLFCMHKAVLTESLSFSFLAGMCAAVLFFVNRPKVGSLALFTVCAWLFALIRDSNGYSVAMLGLAGIVVTFVLVWRRAVERRVAVLCLAGSAIAIVAFLFACISASIGQRWQYSFYNNISRRVLVSKSRTDWFAAHGMPVSDALKKRTNKWAFAEDYAYFHDPELESFRRWTAQSGRGTYMKWLIEHPRDFLQPLRDLKRITHSRLTQYAPTAFKPVELLPYNIEAENPLVWIFIAGCLLAAAFRRVLPRSARLMAIPIALLILAIPHYLLVWHGDPMELTRHSSQVALQVRIAGVIGIALALDFLGLAAD